MSKGRCERDIQLLHRCYFYAISSDLHCCSPAAGRTMLPQPTTMLFLLSLLALPSAYGGPAIKFLPEEPCSRSGGLCGLESACPPATRHPRKGLCPRQQFRGAECCYSVPTNLVNCRDRGGECRGRDMCGQAPQDPRGMCGEGQVCCILIF